MADPKLPALPPVPLPNALNTLGGFLLLGRGMPELVPQAAQQLGQMQQLQAQQNVTGAQMNMEEQVRLQERQDKLAQQTWERNVKELDMKADQAFRDKQIELRNRELDLQAKQAEYERTRLSLQKSESQDRSSALLNEMWNTALAQVNANSPRMKLKDMPDTYQALFMAQYREKLAKEGPVAANAMLDKMGGGLSQSDQVEQAAALMRKNPAFTNLLASSGKTEEQVFAAPYTPPGIESMTPEEQGALGKVTDLTLRKASLGQLNEAENADLGSALRVLGFSKGLSAVVNDKVNDIINYWDSHGLMDREHGAQIMSEIIQQDWSEDRIQHNVPPPVSPSVKAAGPLATPPHKLFGRMLKAAGRHGEPAVMPRR